MGFKNGSEKPKQVQQLKMLTDDANNSFMSWDGQIYHNDLIRSIIRVKARTVGKAIATHVRKDAMGLTVNPQPYMRILLEEPNPIMTMQQMLEKVVTQLELNNNAFIYINRDAQGFPIGLYPIVSTGIQVYQSPTNEYLLQFNLKNSRTVTFKYSDLIHLRQDFHDNELFGAPNHESLRQLMEVQGTLDQGIVKAIKNSNVIQWLLKFNSNLSPDDLKKSTKAFVDSFLTIENADFAGAASVDNKLDAIRVEPKSFMPNADIQKETNKRIYSYFNIHEGIVQSKYTEDEWIAFYESVIEPIVKQLSDAFTQKLFTRKERSYGNKIVFEGSNLSFASMKTKLELVKMVDRGILSPNEMREFFSMSPVPHGNEYLIRLDTVKQGDESQAQASLAKGGE